MSFRKIFNSLHPSPHSSLKYKLTHVCGVEAGGSLGDFSTAQNLIKIN